MPDERWKLLVGKYVELTWVDPVSDLSQSAAGVLTHVNMHDEACLDWGYAVSINLPRFNMEESQQP